MDQTVVRHDIHIASQSLEHLAGVSEPHTGIVISTVGGGQLIKRSGDIWTESEGYSVLVGRERLVRSLKMGLDSHAEVTEEQGKPFRSRVPPKLKDGRDCYLTLFNNCTLRAMLGSIVKQLGYDVAEVVWKPHRVILDHPSRNINGILYVQTSTQSEHLPGATAKILAIRSQDLVPIRRPHSVQHLGGDRAGHTVFESDPATIHGQKPSILNQKGESLVVRRFAQSQVNENWNILKIPIEVTEDVIEIQEATIESKFPRKFENEGLGSTH